MDGKYNYRAEVAGLFVSRVRAFPVTRDNLLPTMMYVCRWGCHRVGSVDVFFVLESLGQ